MTVYALHAVHWKHLQIAGEFVPCQRFRNTAFLKNAVSDTQTHTRQRRSVPSAGGGRGGCASQLQPPRPSSLPPPPLPPLCRARAFLSPVIKNQDGGSRSRQPSRPSRPSSSVSGSITQYMQPGPGSGGSRGGGGGEGVDTRQMVESTRRTRRSVHSENTHWVEQRVLLCWLVAGSLITDSSRMLFIGLYVYNVWRENAGTLSLCCNAFERLSIDIYITV